MNRIPGNPRFVARNLIGMLPDLARADELARSLERAEVDGGTAERGSVGPQFSASRSLNVWWVRITAQHPTGSSQPQYYYSWQLVYFERGDGDTGEHLDDDSVAEGAYDGVCPAFETSLNKNVPVDGSAVVPAWLAEDGQTLLFSYPTGSPADSTFEGDVTFEGEVTFAGPTNYNDDGTPVVVLADLDNFALTAFPVQLLDVQGAFALTGIVAGVHGRRVTYVNVGNATLTIKFEDVASDPANRVCTPYTDHADVLLPPNCWVEFQYDATAALGVGRWRVMFVSYTHLYGTDEAIGGLATIETDFIIDQRWPCQVWTPAAGGTRLNSLANGKRGQWYWIQVADGDDALTIGHQDSSGAAGNLINCPAKQDYVVPPCGGAVVFYDGAYWNVLAIAQRPTVILFVDIDLVIPAPANNVIVIINIPLTADRTITLPAASQAKAGINVTIMDKGGTLGTPYSVTVLRAGSSSDTINGATSKVMSTPYSKLSFTSDGSSKWTYNPAAAGSVTLNQYRIGVGDSSNQVGGTDNFTHNSGLTSTATENSTGTVGQGVTHRSNDTTDTNSPGLKVTRTGGTLASPADTAANMRVLALIGALRSSGVESERIRVDFIAQSATLCDLYVRVYFSAAWQTVMKVDGGTGAVSYPLLTASKILGLDASKVLTTLAETGSGDVVRATSPTLVTPALGTPASGTLTNCTGYPFTALTSIGAQANHNTTQAISNNSWSSAALNTEDWDTNAFHDTSTNNSRMTVPSGKGGKYLLTGSIQFAANATGIRGIRFMKNGSTTVGLDLRTANAATTTTNLALAFLANLSAGDYVEVQVYQNSGGNLNLDSAGGYSPILALSYIGA